MNHRKTGQLTQIKEEDSYVQDESYAVNRYKERKTVEKVNEYINKRGLPDTMDLHKLKEMLDG